MPSTVHTSQNSSNADRLKKAMAQRSKPTFHKNQIAFDDISYNPHMSTISTISSSSDGSCMSLDTNPRMHSQQSSQHTISRKHPVSNGTTFSDFQAPTLCSDSSFISSPTSTGHSEYSRFGRVVANSINSYSSLDSQESRLGPRRLFEKTNATKSQNPHSTAAPVFVLAKSEDDDDVSEVIGSYQDDIYTGMSLVQLDAYNAQLVAQQCSDTSYYTKPARSSTTHNRSIYDDARVADSCMTHKKQQPSHYSFYDSDFNDNQISFSDNTRQYNLGRRSSMTSLHNRILSVDQNDLPSAAYSPPHRHQRRRNSTSSDMSRRNSIMQPPSSAGPLLNLDLDSVIRNALVASSTYVAPANPKFRNQPSLEDEYKAKPVYNGYPVSPAYASPQYQEQEPRVVQREPEVKTKSNNMARLGTSMMKLARKIAN